MPKKWLSDSEAMEYLAGQREGRLATTDQNGQPYITPLNYIVHEGKMYFHSALKGRKLDNIAVNSRVCFEVSHTDKNVFNMNPCDSGTRFCSVLVFGKASVIEDAAKKIEVLTVLTQRFAEGSPFRPIDENMASSCVLVEISIDQISGKRNVDPAAV